MSELKARDPRTCPECGGQNLHQTSVSNGGHAGHTILPGLGGWLLPAGWRVVVCGDCGLVRLYADATALNKLTGSNRWSRL